MLVLRGDVLRLPSHVASIRGSTSPQTRVEQPARTTKIERGRPMDEAKTSAPEKDQPHPFVSGPEVPLDPRAGPRKRQRVRRGQTFLERAEPTARSAALLEVPRFTSRARPRPRPTPSRPDGACSRRPVVRTPSASEEGPALALGRSRWRPPIAAGRFVERRKPEGADLRAGL
jgi:hypothetical protein